MHKRASHSSGMSKENSPSCKAAVGLAFQKSLGQKGAGGDHLGQPRLNARRAAEHPPRSIFFFSTTKKRVLLLMSFKVHMHSLGVLTHPALMSTDRGPLTGQVASCSLNRRSEQRESTVSLTCIAPAVPIL